MDRAKSRQPANTNC